MINLGVRVPLSILHARLGHNNERTTKDIVNKFDLPMTAKCMTKCQACIVGKLHQESYPLQNKNVTSLPLDLVSADVWGPVPMKSAYDSRFYVLLSTMQLNIIGSLQLHGNHKFLRSSLGSKRRWKCCVEEKFGHS